MALFPNPDLMTFHEWASYVILDVVPDRDIGRPDPDANWTEWAQQMTRAEILGPLTPQPRFYETWQDWARAVAMVGVS